MDSNPHYDTAALILQRVVENPGWYGDTPIEQVLARAQVEATLALAFEQRTANLIACASKVYVPGANDQVKERLGG
ncbi:hypothetical protein SEA_BRUHMOMENT_50 [Arthrobacter phage BruhMoment]|nr:hypothetical protein SEA_BRUHMOMENT_50 [Arthrobacter phage BruhMoment]